MVHSGKVGTDDRIDPRTAHGPQRRRIGADWRSRDAGGTFGGPERDKLYVLEGENIYGRKMEAKGVKKS